MHFRDDREELCYLYPILQSVSSSGGGSGSSSGTSGSGSGSSGSSGGSSTVDAGTGGSTLAAATAASSSSSSSLGSGAGAGKSKGPLLEPWHRNESKVKFALYGDHPLSGFMDSSWGSCVQVAIRDLVDGKSQWDNEAGGPAGLQRERRGWVNVRWSSGHAPPDSATAHSVGLGALGDGYTDSEDRDGASVPIPPYTSYPYTPHTHYTSYSRRRVRSSLSTLRDYQALNTVLKTVLKTVL